MTLTAAITAPAARWRAIAPTRPRLALAAITLIVLAIALAEQVSLGLGGDVSWLISLDEQWLSGKIPYVDFVEINPPASLMLYWPAVVLAHAIRLRPEFVVAAFGFASAAASLALSASILKRAGLIASVQPIAYAFALIALAALPGEAFCERDYLAAVYALPYLALSVARVERGPISLPLAALAGLGLGLMAAIKPPYLLMPIGLAPYLWLRIGPRVLLRSAEYYVGAALGAAYLAIIARAFPDYARDVLPMAAEIYVPIRVGLAGLFTAAGGLLFLAIGVLLVRVAEGQWARSWIAVPALAALGAFAAYLVQGKGWLYQAQPALMFLMIAAGFALDSRWRPVWVAGLAALAVAACGVLASGNLAVSVGAAAGLAAWLHRRHATLEAAPWMNLLPRYALIAAIGAACGLSIAERPLAPAIEAALTRLGPHPTLVGVTEAMGFGHPMTRRIGAVWVQRAPSLFITSAVRRLIDEHPGDRALAERLRPYAERDKTMLIEDIDRNRPDALLVGPLNTRMHEALWADPEITRARADYRLLAINDRPDFPAELWVRKDLLRPATGGWVLR